MLPNYNGIFLPVFLWQNLLSHSFLFILYDSTLFSTFFFYFLYLHLFCPVFEHCAGPWSLAYFWTFGRRLRKSFFDTWHWKAFIYLLCVLILRYQILLEWLPALSDWLNILKITFIITVDFTTWFMPWTKASSLI